MSRAVKEWIGRNDNTHIPARVKDRIELRAKNRCEKCGASTTTQGVEIDHVMALINWIGDEEHGNRESNLQALGKKCCHPKKTAEDVAIKSLTARQRKARLGFSRTRQPVPGSKASGIRKRMNGTVLTLCAICHKTWVPWPKKICDRCLDD